MRIVDCRSEHGRDRARIVATIVWEHLQRPQQEIYFETGEEFATELEPDPQMFLVGCLLPAMHHGEQRVWLEGNVCPVLKEGLDHVMVLMRHWFYKPQHDLVRIEGKASQVTHDNRTGRAGSLFSSGVDSLALLRTNHLHYPAGHAGHIKDALLILGQNIESDMSDRTCAQAVTDLTAVTSDVDMTLIPVYTNIRSLEEDTRFFLKVNLGAIMASVAHVFSRRIDTVSIASTNSIPALTLANSLSFVPHGSHPLVDPYYSSAALQIHHQMLTLSRLDRIRTIIGWQAGLQNIRVCGQNWPGGNCGVCEKCVRTMLALLALGALDKTKAFPFDDLTEDMVAAVRLKKFTTTVGWEYLELIPPLEEKGRHDLVRAIHHVLNKSRHHSSVKLWLTEHFRKLKAGMSA